MALHHSLYAESDDEGDYRRDLSDDDDEPRAIEEIVEGEVEPFNDSEAAAGGDDLEDLFGDPNAPGTSAEKKDVKEKKVRKMSSVPKMNTERLKGPGGIVAIDELFKDFKMQGRGHEAEDLDQILNRMKTWTHRMYPRFSFPDCVEQIERLGHKKDIKNFMLRNRNQEIPPDVTPIRLLDDEDEAAEDDPAPMRLVDDSPPPSPPPQLAEDLLERMRLNREAALNRRKDKMREREANGVTDNDVAGPIDETGVPIIAPEAQNTLFDDSMDFGTSVEVRELSNATQSAVLPERASQAVDDESDSDRSRSPLPKRKQKQKNVLDEDSMDSKSSSEVGKRSNGTQNTVLTEGSSQAVDDKSDSDGSLSPLVKRKQKHKNVTDEDSMDSETLGKVFKPTNGVISQAADESDSDRSLSPLPKRKRKQKHTKALDDDSMDSEILGEVFKPTNRVTSQAADESDSDRSLSPLPKRKQKQKNVLDDDSMDSESSSEVGKRTNGTQNTVSSGDASQAVNDASDSDRSLSPLVKRKHKHKNVLDEDSMDSENSADVSYPSDGPKRKQKHKSVLLDEDSMDTETSMNVGKPSVGTQRVVLLEGATVDDASDSDRSLSPCPKRVCL